MRYLVRDYINEALAYFKDPAYWRLRSGIEQCVGENDSAGILHATKASSANYQRKFFVGVGGNRLTEKLQRRICRRETLHRKVLVSDRNIISKWGDFPSGRLQTSKLPDSDNHAIGRNRNRLGVGPGASGISSVFDSFKFAIGNYRIARRRCYRKSYRSLRRRMIQAGNPMMDPVRPVVADGGWLACLVGCQNQAIFRLAVIGDNDDEVCPAAHRFR